MDIHLSFFKTDVMFRLLESGTQRAGHGLAREMVFMRLLIANADGMRFRNYSHFASMTDSPCTICRHVWDFCVEHGILVQDDDGQFSSHGWLVSNGLVNDAKTRPKRVQTQKTDCSQCDDVDAPTGGVVAQETPVQSGRRRREDLVAVRPNVFLSHSEINTLRGKYSDSDITKMVDYYSEWKRKKGGTFNVNDYQSIERWVYKILNDKRQNVTADVAEIPDWVHGGTNERKRGGGAN